MTGDPLDRIETWGKGLRDSQIRWGDEVLALVEVARAARAVCISPTGEDWHAGMTALRAALARLGKDTT